jgi:hypothetical protein
MSVAGLCSVCSAGDVAGGCERCGAMVCREHYDAETGFCTDCLRELGRRPGGGSAREGDGHPDVGEYRF